MAQIHGTCEDRFEPVRAVLAGNLDSGLDVGASVAVVLDGEPVVDLWGGTLDDGVTAWERDTIINVWSTTKPMVALCALMLADRGDLDLDAPVARYWPEFAAAGKGAVLVRHLLGHTSGVAGWDRPMRSEDLYEWELCTSRLAAQAPWWEPGTASGYHAYSQGYLVGEVIGRVVGVSIGKFFAGEVAGPLGADFHIGTGPEHDHRVAKVIPPPPLPFDPDPTSISYRVLSNPAPSAEASWEPAWRRAEIPAVGGHGNARSVAAVQTALACAGTVNGVRLLSAKGCERIFDEQSDGIDLVLGQPLRFGMGYGLPLPGFAFSPNPRHCFWGGWGGSGVLVDLDARLTAAFVMNKMGGGTLGDSRLAGLVAATYAALDS